MDVLIAFGGNLGDLERAFGRAREALAERFDLVAFSSLWRTRAEGPAQPDFLNAALVVRAAEHPHEILAFCQRLEGEAGRERRTEIRWEPRPLDLDLLMIPGVVIDGPDLVLPHPRLGGRLFALLPAAELVPGWMHPHHRRTIAELATSLDPSTQPCERLGEWK